MYSNDLFWGIDLYEIMMMLGLLSALFVFDKYLSKRKISAKVQNFYLILGVVSIIVGIYAAELVQSFFNFLKKGYWEWEGMTFYGGVLGGAIAFLLGLFIVGKYLFKDKEHIKEFHNMLEVAPCCITIAHAIGRIGCLCAGCCYGRETDAWYGVMINGVKRVPVQLYESLFLFALFAVLSVLYKKHININFIVYFIGYGTWRFIIEFFRADDRGYFLGTKLSPAQTISLCLIAAGIIMIIFKIIKKKKAQPNKIIT